MYEYDHRIDSITEIEQMKYRIAEKFDLLSMGEHAPNGRYVFPCDVLDDLESISDHNLFWEVEYLYYHGDPLFNNSICYWNQLPESQEDLDELSVKIKSGDTIAMCALGLHLYREGKYDEYIDWFQNAARAGEPWALIRLAEEYLDGSSKNIDNAIKCLEAAIRVNGSGVALYRLGLNYLNGKGVNKNIEEGLSLLHRSARQGNSSARKVLGDLYYDGIVVEKNSKEALKWYEASASGYNVDAYNNLMTVLLELNNPERRLLWTKRYLEMGEPLALFFMGTLYSSGSRDEKVARKGVEYMFKAVEMGSAIAEYNLAKMQSRAYPEDSMRHLRKAAFLGHAEAAAEYGKLIWEANRELAEKFIRLAADRDIAPAIDFLREHGL